MSAAETACLSVSAVQKLLHVEEPEQVERHATSHEKQAGKLEFDAWPDFRNFRIWRMNLRSAVSSCASRPIEAMRLIIESESAKSIADPKTPYSITGAELQTHFEVLDSKIASGHKKIINLESNRRVFLAFSREGRSHG